MTSISRFGGIDNSIPRIVDDHDPVAEEEGSRGGVVLRFNIDPRYIDVLPIASDKLIRSFKSNGVEDIFNGKNSKAASKTLPSQLHDVGRRKLEMLDSISVLEALIIPPSNQLEALKGDRKGQYSIRINKQYRVCFRWTGADAEDVEIVDYH